MRFIKMLGLAAITAMVAMAFVGTGSASAFHRYVLCSTPTFPWQLCPFNNVIRLWGRRLYPLIGVSTFKGSAITEECSEAMAKGSKTEEELEDEGGLEDTLESFTFSGCKPCTSVKASTPIKTNVNMMSEEEGAEEPNWLMTISNFSVTFEGCPLGVKCKFGSAEITPTIENGEEEASFNTNGAKLNLEEGKESLCGSSVQWNARFALVFTLHTGMEHVVWWSLYFL